MMATININGHALTTGSNNAARLELRWHPDTAEQTEAAISEVAALADAIGDNPFAPVANAGGTSVWMTGNIHTPDDAVIGWTIYFPRGVTHTPEMKERELKHAENAREFTKRVLAKREEQSNGR